MKNTVILCLFTLLSTQTHGAGELRKRIFRPFSVAKTHQSKEQREKQLAEMVTSLSNLELIVFHLELRDHIDDIETLEEVAQLTRKEISRRIGKDEQSEILEMLASSLTERLDNILHNPVMEPYFFKVFQDAAREDLPESYRGILQEFLSTNIEAIMALDPTPKQLKGLIRVGHSTDASIKILQKALDEGDAYKFLTIFDAIAIPSPSDEYRDALDKLFVENAGMIGELPLSHKQIKLINEYIQRVGVGIMLLEMGLKQAQGNAQQFFAAFNAIAVPSPNEDYQLALSKFFTDNAETIEELPLYPKQVKRIAEYISRIGMSIRFLNMGLNQAGGNADRFFDIFKAITEFPPSESYQDALDKFFTTDAEAIGELSLSAKQIEHIARYINKDSTEMVFLEQGLKRAKDADEFFAIFNAIAWASPPDEAYLDILNKFFIQNADRIKEFAFSTKQVERIGLYINRDPTLIVLLEGGLKHAGGDADKFFALFRAIAYDADEPYQDALNTFFIDNAEKIMNLGLSVDQVEYLNHKIGRYSTSIRILELALKKAKHVGDFFNIFHVIVPDSPKGKAKHIYGNFLTDHARSILDLGPSLDQLDDLVVRYIPSASAFFDTAEAQKKHRKKRKKKRDACADNVATIFSPDALPENIK